MAQLTDVNGTATVIPEGDIVASTVPVVREKLLEAVSSGAESVALDLGGIKVVDSMGIALIIAANNSLAARNGKLRLENVDQEIYSLMVLMRLDQHMDIRSA